MTKVLDYTARTDARVYNERPDGAASIKGIILHHTGSTNEQGDYLWLSHYHDDPVSIHKLMKRDGTIIKIVPEAQRAWHAGPSLLDGHDGNDVGIGYEICNDGHAEAYTDAQYESVSESVAYDTALYHIPDNLVTTHKAVRDAWLKVHPGEAAKKYDPFGWDHDRMWKRVREIRAAWPQGWPPLWYCSGH